MAERDTLRAILDLARWAPSGDNTQPWRFEIVADDHIAIHGHDTRDWCVYDFDGHASHLAHGALLETLRIAASGFGMEARWRLRQGGDDRTPVYDVFLARLPGLAPDPLLPHVEARVVQRRPMHTTPLTASQRQALAEAPGRGYRVHFFESFAERLAVARLLWDNAYIRLTSPEAYQVHREIIEWGARFSKDRIPEGAVGVDPLTGKLMRWVMQGWPRVRFFNRYLFGTVAPRLQLDLVPALACASHVLLRASKPLNAMEDYVAAGAAMQRLWLTATQVGLFLQPEMTPLIFRWYARSGREMSSLPAVNRRVRQLADRLDELVGAENTQGLAFFCRVGRSEQPVSRSVRRDLSELMVE